MSERHEKWTPVSPGTVIPAGQPYRTEFPAGEDHDEDRQIAADFLGSPTPFTVDGLYDGTDYSLFIDSSWKPPLALPTAPGSLIEATPVEMSGWDNSRRLWWRQKDGYWHDLNDDLIKDSKLILNRVLFDPEVIDNSGEF